MRARFAAKLVEVLPPHLPACLPGQQRRRGHGRRAQVRAAWSPAAPRFVAFTLGVSRPHDWRAVGDLGAEVPRAVPDRCSRRRTCPTTTLGGAGRRRVDDQTAAVVLEVVQGEGGVNLGTPSSSKGAQRLCRERGALLIVDEIQTGFGRTGNWFGLEHFDLEPDIICLAKGLGGGFPMGAFAYTEPVQAALFAGAHGSTFGGNPLACAAGLAAITPTRTSRSIERSAAHGCPAAGRSSPRRWPTPRVVREIRGLGLMIGIELRQKSGPYLKRLMDEHGVLALPAGPTVLRLLPPLYRGRRGD